MERDIYTSLLAWKRSKSRKPLVLQGARQVGKTFVLKQFGKQEYAHCVYLNFEKDPKLAAVFRESLEPSTILKHISLIQGSLPDSKDTLIVLDEIQECPEALKSLKYFHENANEYHVAAAGSLLGVKLNETKGFPVGQVNLMMLYPCSFFEFLNATGKAKLCEYLKALTTIGPLPETLHTELTSLLKNYFMVGGMPEAIVHYAAEESLENVREVHQTILKTYEFDFAKHADPHQVMKISHVWDHIPAQLAKENKKFIFTAISPSARAREYETAIEWLKNAGLIHKIHHVGHPAVPLEGHKDMNIFKIYAHDIGLLATKSQIPCGMLLEGHRLFAEYKGALTENFVVQALTAHLQRPLYYWTSQGTAEVDFIIQTDLDIVPLEVKAGESRRKKSLLVYGEKYHPRCLYRASLMNFRQDGNLVNYPLYLLQRFSGNC